MSTFSEEVARGQRFEFGKNWSAFLSRVNDERINAAVEGLQQLLQVEHLQGRSFVDVGSGSGLSSLAAMRLEAGRVHSFDFDPSSVACTRELKRRTYPAASNWTIEEGSALDREYLTRLGTFDVVYSWGVLHHTGDLWQAVENVTTLVAPGGLLALALYNDQGPASRRWLRIKRAYNANLITRIAVILGIGGFYTARQVAGDLGRGRNPIERIRRYRSSRGMSWWHDLLDWLGGLPFEVASVDRVQAFFTERGFAVAQVRPADGWANNEFLLRRLPSVTREAPPSGSAGS